MRQRILARAVFGESAGLRIEIGKTTRGFIMPGFQGREAMARIICCIARGL